MSTRTCSFPSSLSVLIPVYQTHRHPMFAELRLSVLNLLAQTVLPVGGGRAGFFISEIDADLI